MKFKFEAELGNALNSYSDLATALRGAASRLEAAATGQPIDGHSGPVKDRNGELVGQWAITD